MTAPSLLILGTDAVLAAAPATPVQLAHACHAAGFDAVVPTSWGDELIAREAIRALEFAKSPLVHCVCPRAARRLADDPAIGPMVFSCPAPPVVTAAYLRAVSAPSPVHITFAGGCTSGAHASIDVWLSPEDLLGEFARLGIALAGQPTEFDAVLPPDRRRHFSEPGGLPCAEVLDRMIPSASIVELRGEDFAIDVAQHLLAETPILIDVSAALGCTCAGAMAGASSQAARARVREVEPPRAPSPVVDHDVELPRDVSDLRHRLGATPGHPAAASGASAPAAIPSSDGLPPAALPQQSATPALTAVEDDPAGREPPRRPSPRASTRVVMGAMPHTRGPARTLPRAYVARRRSSPKEIRQSGIARQVRSAGRVGFRPAMLIAVAAVFLAVAALVLVVAG